MAGVVTAAILYLAQRKMKFKEFLSYCFDGVMSMGFVLVLSVLAFAVQSANTDLGLANFIIEITTPIMKGAFLPAVVFLVCGVYAYATGCFWDLAAIILPLVVRRRCSPERPSEAIPAFTETALLCARRDVRLSLST